MKAKIVNHISRKYLLPNLPDFSVKGHLLYHQDIQYLLRGFCFESSAFNRESFTINVFVQPLYVPRNYLSFTIGNRVGLLNKGRDIWWDYEEAQERKIMEEVLSLILSDGIPFLEKHKSLKELTHQYQKSDKGARENKHVIEAVGYAYVLLDDYLNAKKLFDFSPIKFPMKFKNTRMRIGCWK